ncbi:MAG: PilZ domain-containing protein, partial [Myxococcota bacterium]
MSESEKKRRHDRIEAPTITLQVAEGERPRRRFLRDLSQGGVYIRTGDVKTVGSEVRLELTPPGWETTIKVRGEVVRVATVSDHDGDEVPVGMGIQFKDVGPKNAELLAELMSEYQSSSPQLEEEAPLPDEIDVLQREVRALRTRLREARAMMDELHREVETLEDDDDSNRAIIERLAIDKKQLKSDLEERESDLVKQLQEKHARELRTILDGYEKR